MKKVSLVLLCLVTAAALLCGCGASGKSSDAYFSDENSSSASYDTSYDMEIAAEGFNGYSGTTDSKGAPFAQSGLKVIYNATVNLETLDYDKSYADILSAVSAVGGYISSQYINGGYRLSNDRYTARYAEFTLRIPAERLEAFLEQGETFGNVTSVVRELEDITAQYIDTEARLNSLKAQEERLLDMLDRAATLDELLSLEDHLAQLRYEIESYTSTMNTYDQLVAYSTVTVYLNEVSVITSTPENFGDRLLRAVTGSLRGAVDFLESLLFFLIYALPYLVAVGLLLLLLRALLRRRAKRRLNQSGSRQNVPSDIHGEDEKTSL